MADAVNPPKIKAVIFDIGGVVAPDTDRFIWAEALKRFPGKIFSPRTLRNPAETKNRFDAYLNRLQKGLIDERRFWSEVFQVPESRISAHDAVMVFKRPYEERFKVNPEMAKLLVELRNKGIRLVALSNTVRAHSDVWKPALEQYFDAVLASNRIGSVKPEDKAFRVAIKVSKANPKNILFVDDRMLNADAARRHGLNAAVFKSEPLLRNDMIKLRINVSPAAARKGEKPAIKRKISEKPKSAARRLKLLRPFARRLR